MENLGRLSGSEPGPRRAAGPRKTLWRRSSGTGAAFAHFCTQKASGDKAVTSGDELSGLEFAGFSGQKTDFGARPFSALFCTKNGAVTKTGDIGKTFSWLKNLAVVQGFWTRKPKLIGDYKLSFLTTQRHCKHLPCSRRSFRQVMLTGQVRRLQLRGCPAWSGRRGTCRFRSWCVSLAPRVARSRGDATGRSCRLALAAAALCGPSGRACCRPQGPRSTSGARALRRPSAEFLLCRAAALSKCARLSLESTGWCGGAATRPSRRSGPCALYSLQPPVLLGVAPRVRLKEKWPLCRKQRGVLDDVRAWGALLENVVVLSPSAHMLPHEDEDFHPPALRSLGKSTSVGQSGLPARVHSSCQVQCARVRHVKQRWSSLQGFQRAFFFARVSGILLAPPASSTVVPIWMMLKPEVDFLVVGHPAQSASLVLW